MLFLNAAGPRERLRVYYSPAKRCVLWSADPQYSPLECKCLADCGLFPFFAGIFYRRISSAKAVQLGHWTGNVSGGSAGPAAW